MKVQTPPWRLGGTVMVPCQDPCPPIPTRRRELAVQKDAEQVRSLGDQRQVERSAATVVDRHRCGDRDVAVRLDVRDRRRKPQRAVEPPQRQTRDVEIGLGEVRDGRPVERQPVGGDDVRVVRRQAPVLGYRHQRLLHRAGYGDRPNRRARGRSADSRTAPARRWSTTARRCRGTTRRRLHCDRSSRACGPRIALCPLLTVTFNSLAATIDAVTSVARTAAGSTPRARYGTATNRARSASAKNVTAIAGLTPPSRVNTDMSSEFTNAAGVTSAFHGVLSCRQATAKAEMMMVARVALPLETHSASTTKSSGGSGARLRPSSVGA